MSKFAQSGLIPVAILGTENLDVRTIDPTSIKLVRDGIMTTVSPIRYDYQDVATPFYGVLCNCHNLGGDGKEDLVLSSRVSDAVSNLNLNETGDVELMVTVEPNGEGCMSILGADCVKVLKAKK